MAAVSARFARALTKTLVGGGNGAVQSLSCADHRIAGDNAMFNKLVAHLDSIKARDPAPRSRWEILLYPGLLAVGMHRIAPWLFAAELFFHARFVNHLVRWLTGELRRAARRERVGQ